MTRARPVVHRGKSRSAELDSGGSGRLLTRVQFANMWNVASGLKELIALSLLAGLGCGVAVVHRPNVATKS
jgi:hypothetical protein